MAKGSYNISVSSDSTPHEERNNNENQECMNSCLSPAFLRSLSLYDRPRASRVPTNKELLKSRYKALVSSLEKIPSNPSPPSEARYECSTKGGSENVGIYVETEVTAQPSIYDASPSEAHQLTDGNQLSESNSWVDDRYTRFSVGSEKLLEKTVAVLRSVDNDISESLTNLTKPESIALESVVEIYRNRGKNTAVYSADSELDLMHESSCEPIYENWQPCNQQRQKNGQVLDFSVESSSQPIYENWWPSTQQIPKDVQAHYTPERSSDLQARSSRQSPKRIQIQSSQPSSKNADTHSSQQNLTNVLANSPGRSPQNLLAQSSNQSPKNSLVQPSNQSPKNSLAQSTNQSPKNSLARSTNQSPKNSLAQSRSHSPQMVMAQSPRQSCQSVMNQFSQQSPNTSFVHSAPETLKNFKAVLSLNSSNMQSLNQPDSDVVRSVKQSPTSPKISESDDTTQVKSVIEFDLPSDHEQFIKIMGALQNRCLEYREMIQDISVSALEECLSFSGRSISRIRHLRRQFESQKKNFSDFRELCCKSVVFGPDSLPINEKVTEVIQSFYLRLLQEENETFMARLEFGLKMGEVYAKMLKLETESKKVIATLKKEIVYLKKTSVGFKV